MCQKKRFVLLQTLLFCWFEEFVIYSWYEFKEDKIYTYSETNKKKHINKYVGKENNGIERMCNKINKPTDCMPYTNKS